MRRPLLFVVWLLLLASLALPPGETTAVAAGWHFNEDGNFEGWSPNDGIVDPTVADGVLSFSVRGIDPWLLSAPLSVPAADNNVVVVRMRNGTGNVAGRIYWATDADPNLSQSKSIGFELVPNDSGYRDYRIDMRYATAWTGTITRLRVDPADNPTETGPMSIDSITFEFDEGGINDPSEGDRKPVPHIGVVDRVAIDSEEITIEGRIADSAPLDEPILELYELAPYQYEHDHQGLVPIAIQVASAGSRAFRFTVQRFVSQHDRSYSKFLVVARDPAVPDEPHFVDNPKYAFEINFAAKYDYPFPPARSKKGLQVQMVDDAEELGIGHAGINVVFDRLMLLRNENPATTITYVSDGQLYFFDKAYVEQLDAQIKPLSDNGVIVNLILILYRNSSPNSAFPKLVHPDAALGQGIVYAFNTANAEGVAYLRAAMEFVTERYTRSDQKYGRAVGFIVGNEVDSQWVWQNMGDQTLNQFMDNYERTTRLVYQAARKHYSHPRVYISLDHFWNMRFAAEITRYYKGRDVIDKMNELSKENGDFPWHVAHHPYPENLFNPATWNDTTAHDSYDTPRVTFKNLHVLTQYMREEPLRYQGEPRRIILSEQGFNTPDLSESAQKLQAAAYAYAYYKVLFSEGIDSFILHRHVDHKHEGGLRLGLWSWDEARPESSSPGERKLIYDVFQRIDTAESLDVTEFALPIIGISDWAEVVPSFDPALLDQRTPPWRGGASFIQQPLHALSVSDFEGDLAGWAPAENARSVGPSEDAASGARSLKVDFSALAKLWRGTVYSFAAPRDASLTPYLTLALKLPSYEPADDYYAKIKVYDGLSVAEGIVALDKAAGWQRVALDLRGWKGLSSIDRIKVWVGSHTNKDWPGALLVDDVAFAERVVPSGGVTNLDIVASAMRLAPGQEVEVTVTNHDVKSLEESIVVQDSAEIAFDEESLDVTGLQPGQSRSYTLHITQVSAEPDQPVAASYRYRARLLTRTIRMRPDPTGESTLPEHVALLYNFEGDTQGWQPETNVVRVSSATSFLNAPGHPRLGQYVLAAETENVPADHWRRVKVVPAEPLDLSDAQSFFYHINHYGGVPGATYEAQVTLFSGSEQLSRTYPTTADSWNEIRVDLSGWPARNAITRIDIAFRAVGSSIGWNGQFQLDFIGYERAQ